MGGEPTFVSIDDMEGEEWNTKALGKNKLKLSEKLLQSLKQEFAPQGYIHHGQGKWYPGEQLPRWALGIFWRTDEKPLWHEQGFLASPEDDSSVPKNASQRFIQTLAENLGLDKRFIVPAYEDHEFYLHKEGQLPKNVKVTDSKLKDAQERQRLRKVFDQGLTTKIGFFPAPVMARR